MPNSKEYLDRNREHINELKRLKYNSEARKKAYAEKRDTILQDLREKKVMCPICKIDYHRYHVRNHLINRHKLDPDTAEKILTN